MKRRSFFTALAGLALAPFAAKSVAREPAMEVDYYDAGDMRKWKRYVTKYRPLTNEELGRLCEKMREAMARTRFVRPLTLP